MLGLFAAIGFGLLIGLPPGLNDAAQAGGIQSNRSPNQSGSSPNTASSHATPAARMEVEGSEYGQLEAGLHDAEQRVKFAIQAAEDASRIYTLARQRRNPRGAALSQMGAEVTRTKRDQKVAEEDFLQRVEEARREGVPAGVMARYLDLAEVVENLREERERAAED